MYYAIELLQQRKSMLKGEYTRIIKSNKNTPTTFENQEAINLIDRQIKSINEALNQLTENQQAA